jgi:hypothetical protein
MNAIAPTAVMAAIERRFGDLMGRVSPDYRFAFRCLALCDSILYLDRSAVIEHGMARSAGGNFLRGRMNDDARRFVSDLEVERFGETPEPGFETTANAIFQEYCTVRAEAEQGRFPPPDWRSYLAANAVAVDRIEDPEWRGRMRDLLERRGWTRRHAAGRALHLAGRMAAHLVRHPRALARTVKRQLWDRPPGTPTAVLLRRVGIDPRLRDLRFDSAADALAHAVAHPRARTPDAWHLDALRRAGAIVAQRNLEPAGIAHERR